MIIKTLSTSLAALALMASCCGNTCKDAAGAQPECTVFDMPVVVRPSIPAREVSLCDFGGVNDGATLNTEAFARAIDALTEQGGGRLNVPDGVWYTGPIVLKDNIELHLANNAIILFSDDQSLYPLVEVTFEGLDTWRCQSPVSARDAKNIAITGRGIIDGNGYNWRALKRAKVNDSQWKKRIAGGGIVSDDGRTWYPSESFKRGATGGSDQNVSTWAQTREDFEQMHDFLRPVMISLINCENVLLEHTTFQNSPCWNIHPAMCTNLTVNDITVRCPEWAQNGDGIDIESCKNVLLTNSSFDVGDDGICIKSGKNEAGRKRGIPCQNVIVENCVVFHGHGGFVVGSEMSGGVKNCLVRNCTFSGTDVGLRFKSTRGRGGVVEGIWIENIAMNNIQQEALLFDLFYSGKSASEAAAAAAAAAGKGEPTDMPAEPVDETTPAFRDIHIKNISCRGARRAMLFNGLPEMNVERVTVENARLCSTLGAEINESTDVTLRDVQVIPEKGAALKINNAKRVNVERFTCPEGLECALEVTGSRNSDIKVASAQITAENAKYSAASAGKVTLVK